MLIIQLPKKFTISLIYLRLKKQFRSFSKSMNKIETFFGH